MLRAFPMILLAVAAYNALVFGGMAMGHDALSLLGQAVTVPAYSGDAWKITAGDGLLALALLLLFIDTVKAAGTGRREIATHVLSALTFLGATAEFVLLKGFANSPFFFITALCLFDVVSGYTLSVIGGRREPAAAPPEDAH